MQSAAEFSSLATRALFNWMGEVAFPSVLSALFLSLALFTPPPPKIYYSVCLMLDLWGLKACIVGSGPSLLMQSRNGCSLHPLAPLVARFFIIVILYFKPEIKTHLTWCKQWNLFWGNNEDGVEIHQYFQYSEAYSSILQMTEILINARRYSLMC